MKPTAGLDFTFSKTIKFLTIVMERHKAKHDIQNNITDVHNLQFSRPKYEIADIFNRYLPSYLKKHKLSIVQHKAAYAIMNCRTSRLGYHKFHCDECGHEQTEYNSCRNRHCPKCQGEKRLQWINKILKELLPVHYYHAVFTMVHSLNLLAMYNKEIFYDIMMKASGKTLLKFAMDPKYLGAKTGCIGILHSWGQTLSSHLHIHYIIPGGGISKDNKRWINLPYRKNFLFPVKAMSMSIRNTFSKMLQKAYDKGRLNFPEALSELKESENFRKYLNKACCENWICYVKKPFASPEAVVRYIGRYTNRVAISNHRISNIEHGKVSFNYKEYKDGEVTPRIMTLNAEEFIRRFMLHILPHRFRKIRYFGILSNGLKTKYINLARALLTSIEDKIENIKTYSDGLIKNLLKCPNCEKGKMHIVYTFIPAIPEPG